MRKFIAFAIVVLLFFILHFSTSNVFAADPCANHDATGHCIIDTAVGPISTNPPDFVKAIFGAVLGLAGGVALILIVISGYKFMISQGNPEGIKAATEELTSSIIGLLFIVLAFVILQIVGVDILRIPGFGQ